MNQNLWRRWFHYGNILGKSCNNHDTSVTQKFEVLEGDHSESFGRKVGVAIGDNEIFSKEKWELQQEIVKVEA